MTLDENKILNNRQKQFLKFFLRSELKDAFYLSGGTALSAFYLKHRLSEDLDLFSDDEVTLEGILDFLHTIPNISDIKYEKKYDRKIFLLFYGPEEAMKVEFTRYPFPALENKLKIEDLSIDSLTDILANKLLSLTDRRDPKDYIDLYFILGAHSEFKIKEMIAKAEKKFGVKGISYALQTRFMEDFDLSGPLLLEPIEAKIVVSSFRKLVQEMIG